MRSRALSDDHKSVQLARENLANTLVMQGELAPARALHEKVLEVHSRALPDDHPELQMVRRNLAITIAMEQARDRDSAGAAAGSARCTELIRDLCRAQVTAARAAILWSPSREAEERCASVVLDLDTSLSFTQGYGAFEPLRALESDAFVFAETTRGAAIASSEMTRRSAHDPTYAALRDELREASHALAGLTRSGTTSAEFDRARVKREAVERELVALSRELSSARERGIVIDVESLARTLAPDEAAVSFRRFENTRLELSGELDSSGQPAVRMLTVPSLCAFVVRSSTSDADSTTKGDSAPTALLRLVDLGPLEPIEAAARDWREGLDVAGESRGVTASARDGVAPSVHAEGVRLRETVFDPLLPSLSGVRSVVVVLDDVLHLVPFDVLPIDETLLIGDRWRIETRTTLTELVAPSAPSKARGELVAFGDVRYEAEPVRPPNSPGAGTEVAAVVQESRGVAPPRTGERAGILRGSAWAQGFAALPGTGVEVRGIARAFTDEFGADAELELCQDAAASRERLLAVAPKARWLHIATHGWFAPESIQSWSDPEPLDKQSGLGSRMSGEEQVKGMSPMLLCGLALAGANLPENAVGRAPGLVTADELSTLDLSNCELVVLSACDTNVGERRAGQGVASLQKALQMAGARSVITSLWKVPDEATKELMLDFYRRMWVEKKPKHQALWEAKTKLRETKDERGAPKYTTRDWAAWVLTGNPE